MADLTDLTSIDPNALIRRIQPSIYVSPLDQGATDPNAVQQPDYSYWERFGLGNNGDVGPTPHFTVGGSGGSGGGSSTGLAALAAVLHGFLQGQAQRGLLSAQKKNQLVLGQIADIKAQKERANKAADTASERAFELQKIDRTAADAAQNQALPADTEMNGIVSGLAQTSLADAYKVSTMNRQLDQMTRAIRGYKASGDTANANRVQADFDSVKAKRDAFLADALPRADRARVDKATKTGPFATNPSDVNPANYNFEDDGRGGKFLDLSSFQGKTKESARAAAVAAGAKPLDKEASQALRAANQLEESYNWMQDNLGMLPPKGSAIPLGPLGPISIKGLINTATQNTDPRVNQFKMYRDPALQSMTVFGPTGGKGIRYTKEIIKLANSTNVPEFTDPQDIGQGKINNGRKLISIVRDTYLGKQKPPLSSFVRP